jgi:hypothetical protein
MNLYGFLLMLIKIGLGSKLTMVISRIMLLGKNIVIYMAQTIFSKI